MKQVMALGLLFFCVVSSDVVASKQTVNMNSDQLITLQAIEAIYQIKYQLKNQTNAMEVAMSVLQESLTEPVENYTVHTIADTQSELPATAQHYFNQVKAD